MDCVGGGNARPGVRIRILDFFGLVSLFLSFFFFFFPSFCVMMAFISCAFFCFLSFTVYIAFLCQNDLPVQI